MSRHVGVFSSRDEFLALFCYVKMEAITSSLSAKISLFICFTDSTISMMLTVSSDLSCV